MHQGHVPWVIQFQTVVECLEANRLHDELCPSHCLFGAHHDCLLMLLLLLVLDLGVSVLAHLLFHKVAEVWVQESLLNLRPFLLLKCQ